MLTWQHLDKLNYNRLKTYNNDLNDNNRMQMQ